MIQVEYEESVISLVASDGQILPGVDIDTLKMKGDGSVSVALPSCELFHGEYVVRGKLAGTDSHGRATILTEEGTVTSVFDRLTTKGVAEKNSYSVNCDEGVSVAYRTKEVTWEPLIVIKTVARTTQMEISIKLSATVTSSFFSPLKMQCVLSYGDYKCDYAEQVMPGVTRKLINSRIVDAQQRVIMDVSGENILMSKAKLGFVFKAPFDVPKYAARVKDYRDNYGIYVEGMKRHEMCIMVVGSSETIYSTRVDGKRIEIVIDSRKKVNVVVRSCISARYNPKPHQYVDGMATWNITFDPSRPESSVKVIDIVSYINSIEAMSK